jgi:hypothetical protein
MGSGESQKQRMIPYGLIMAEEHVQHWNMVLVMYKLGSLTRDEVTGVSFHYHFVLQQNKYSNGIFWSCF